MTSMPKNPDKESVEILAGARGFEEEFRIGKEEQRKLGLEIVPPNYEMENAAARYRILFEYLTAKAKCTK